MSDYLGSQTIITNEAGEIEQKIDYYPYGVVRINGKAAEFETNHTFTGQEKVEESGLLYYIQHALLLIQIFYLI